MSNQFKVGDLALIIGAFRMTQNIGKQCELIQLLQTDEVYVAPNGVTYQHGDSPSWLVAGSDLSVWFEDDTEALHGWGVHVPAHLMPLQGDTAPAIQKPQAVPA